MKNFFLLPLFLIASCFYTYGQASLLKDMLLTPNLQGSGHMIKVNKTLFFRTDDGVHGNELWKSDGTGAGTVLVKDISAGSGSSNPSQFTELNGILYFRAYDGIHGFELWKSDGTEEGTVLVKDIMPGEASGNPVELTAMNGYLYFRASLNGTIGDELWKSDGTEDGTFMLKDIVVENETGVRSGNPELLTVSGNTLFFRAVDIERGVQLWKSDGTEAGTVKIKNIDPIGSSWPSNLTDVNGILFFNAINGTSHSELWKSDGTEAGTVLVKKFGETESSLISNLVNVNGTLFFTTSEGYNNVKIWKSDGTTEGTEMAINTNADNIPFTDIRYLINVNGTLFFAAENGLNGYDLWKSDGTTTGTVLLKDLDEGISSEGPKHFFSVNDKLYFSGDNGITGDELWISDGTFCGTYPLTDINPGELDSGPSSITEVGGNLYFFASNSEKGRDLYKYIPEAPIALVSPSTSEAISSCQGEQINITSSGTWESYYRWYTTVDISTPIEGAVNSTFSPTVDSDTSFFVSALNAARCEGPRSEITVAIINSTSSSLATTACNSYTAPSGAVYTTSGTFTDIIQNSAGCDSVITIELTVVNALVSTEADGLTFTASTANASYDWINCSTNLPIPGEESQSFTATESGAYSVIVTKDGCTETSDCFAITITGATSSLAANKVSVYPNPTTDIFSLNSRQNLDGAVIRVINQLGQTVLQTKITTGNNHSLNMNNQTPGLYFVEINHNGEVSRLNLMKN